MTFLSRSSKATEEELPAYDHHDEAAPAYSNEKNVKPEKSDSKKREVPVVDFEPIEFNGKMVDWDYMCYNENFSSEILTFVSQDARAKFKALKGSEGQNFDHALELQREGFAMPLLRTDHHTFAALHSTRYMSFYKFIPPPVSENRLFDRKKDKFKFCEATKERCASYYKYELKFTPDPQDPKKNFSLYMIDHHRYPIKDISLYNGQRLRWVADNSWRRSKWSYTLNILRENQPSLIDDLDSNGRVNKNNPLLGNAWKNNLLPMTKPREDFVGDQIGVALETSDYYHSIQCLPPLRFAFSDIIKGEKGEHHTESINSVSQDSLVFLCMTSIIKRIEDIKENARRATY
ncbi:hypothetical protein CLIB1423_09S01046 [[Candida] railenensis]|uniref:Uncharacterized protein n=1 Tax=[Candida] railenensis TaxID=45579 RepID=A0A9P0QR21_9ASCO|nr:hypothetical protein CLIB1423_09S01046 [[Candida] railenensis]